MAAKYKSSYRYRPNSQLLLIWPSSSSSSSSCCLLSLTDRQRRQTAAHQRLKEPHANSSGSSKGGGNSHIIDDDDDDDIGVDDRPSPSLWSQIATADTRLCFSNLLKILLFLLDLNHTPISTTIRYATHFSLRYTTRISILSSVHNGNQQQQQQHRIKERKRQG